MSTDDRNLIAVQCLNAAIDQSGIPRKVLAEDFVGVGEAQFSKLAHSAAIDLIDKLPDEIVLEWLRRMGKTRAFEVRALKIHELDAQLLELLDRIQLTMRVRKRRSRPAKAGLAVSA